MTLVSRFSTDSKSAGFSHDISVIPERTSSDNWDTSASRLGEISQIRRAPRARSRSLCRGSLTIYGCLRTACQNQDLGQVGMRDAIARTREDTTS